MSSPVQLPASPPAIERDVDMDAMEPQDREDEGEGDAVMGGPSDDSSEEPEEDEDEERKVREGFIVDEDDEEAEVDEEDYRRKRKKRKRRHRRRGEDEDEEDEGLEEDDLELLEENTGASFARNKHRLTRLRRGRGSESPPAASSSRRKAVVESSDDDLDDVNLELPQVQDIQRIWDDERAAAAQDEDDLDLDDMDGFIDDDEEDYGGAMDEEEREEKRKERLRIEKERRKVMRSRPELTGIDANAWEEIIEVFGDGHDYDWALEDDDGNPENVEDEERVKPDMKYHDVFEPSEIRARHLTEDDDLIRARDIPERMQLATSSLSTSSTLSDHEPLTQDDLNDAATWVLTRLSSQKERDFFRSDGVHFRHLQDLAEAITNALRFLFLQDFEVPYIWMHKRDYISYFNPLDVRTRVELLTLEDLWRVYDLGQKYRSLVQRRKSVEAAYERFGISDEYYEHEIRGHRTESVEVVADTTEWLNMKYKDKKKDIFEFHFHDDEHPTIDPKKRKMPSRISAYEVAKKSVVSKLADGYGIKPEQIILNFLAKQTSHFVEDQELNPTAFAEQFADPDPEKALSSEDLLRQARMILATELGKDPLLRHEIRQIFKSEAQVSCEPTERGISKIADHHPYNNFKYLLKKRVVDMLESPQFLLILAAESEHLVNVTIALSNEAKSTFERKLNEAFTSDGFSDTARAWNEERARVIQEVVDKHLIPIGEKWVREWLKEEVEDFLSKRCGNILRDRIEIAPYATSDLAPGAIPSVLSVSWGKGDPQKDAITLVFVDEAGRLREHAKVDNLVDIEMQEEFTDLIKRRKPDVIVIGGFSITTAKLSKRVKEIIKGPSTEGDTQTSGWGDSSGDGGWGTDQGVRNRNEQQLNIPVTYINDEVARIYQHSARAQEEFSALSVIARYCVGLARYAQSPLNEYAALGRDITAILFDDEIQHLIPTERLLSAFERTLADVTNKVGVDINRAVNDRYYQHLLPFVGGLGPRKAQVLVRKVAVMGGTLVNRDQFIRGGLLTTKIFLNAAGFLRIPQEPETKVNKSRHLADSDAQDPLDNTRIHPEDYELARKMATDALELDEEDIHDEHPSHVVSLIMQDSDNVKKLDELNLDDFAVNMFETNGDRKRHTLNVIRSELLKPFAEIRKPFPPPDPRQVLTWLSGESTRTLRSGMIVSALVLRINPMEVFVRLDSGIEGQIKTEFVLDDARLRVQDVIKKGQTVPVVVVEVKCNLETDSFTVDLSSRPADVREGDRQFRKVYADDLDDRVRREREDEMLNRKKKAEVDRSRRVIKHPNFHNFNSVQAEAYLEQQQRGDVVIRPSSKGAEHIAVTWKVDEGLYQHIDVVEKSGGHLAIEDRYEFGDLDELIVNHIQAMSRRVEELMAHEKFKQGTDDDLHIFLKNFVAANPSKSVYGFSLNRKRPGHFNLSFLANKASAVQTWPVRVAPEAYYLFDTAAPGVPELCDAFKVRVTHLHDSKNLPGGKTPYGAGRLTPGRTPGHATPGNMSVRQTTRTPNPYSGGGATPFVPLPTAPVPVPPPPYPQAAYGGYDAPTGFPPPVPDFAPQGLPAGMNPARAALIQNGGGWDTQGVGRGW